ncbi:MAG TPA: hypothetical protein VFP94_03150, partial [Terriglobales bacterium]|nr:hypothetical protein [Terriglobales bacterium]
IAINLQETLPTGRFDRLDGRSSAGYGAGSYATTLSLYTQDYFWLPTGRILRMSRQLGGALSRAGARCRGAKPRR